METNTGVSEIKDMKCKTKSKVESSEKATSVNGISSTCSEKVCRCCAVLNSTDNSQLESITTILNSLSEEVKCFGCRITTTDKNIEKLHKEIENKILISTSQSTQIEEKIETLEKLCKNQLLLSTRLIDTTTESRKTSQGVLQRTLNVDQWQKTENPTEGRKIRARMFKIREKRIKEYASDGEAVDRQIDDIQSGDMKVERRKGNEIVMRKGTVTDEKSSRSTGRTKMNTKTVISNEKLINDQIEEVTKGRTDRLEKIISSYEKNPIHNGTVTKGKKFSAQNNAFVGDSYQSIKKKEIRDSASPTRFDYNRRSFRCCSRGTADSSNVDSSVTKTKSIKRQDNTGSMSPKIHRTVKDKSSDKSKTVINKSLTEKSGNIESSKTKQKDRNATSKAIDQKRKTLNKMESCSKLVQYIESDCSPDDEILTEEANVSEDTSGNTVKVIVQTRKRKDGSEYTFRQVASTTRIVDDESNIDEILIGNPDHEVVKQNVEEKVEKDGSKLKIITEVRRTPEGNEYETRNIVKTALMLDYDSKDKISYSEDDELLNTQQSTEIDEKGCEVLTVTETRRKSTGEKYTTNKIFKVAKTVSEINTSSDDEVVEQNVTEETNEDGVIVKVIVKKKRTKDGKEYVQRQTFQARKMTLSDIKIQKGMPILSTKDEVVEKKKMIKENKKGNNVSVTENRRKKDGSKYTFDYDYRSVRGKEKDIENISKDYSDLSKLNTSNDDEVINETVNEELQEDGSTLKTITERRKTKDGIQYLRHRMITIPKLPEPKLQEGSFSDEVLEEKVDEDTLDDGTEYRAITERRKSSVTGNLYTLRRMSKVFHKTLSSHGIDEIIDENVTEEETSDGIIIKTIIRRYKRPDDSVYTTHDVIRTYTNPIQVTADECFNDELADRSYDVRETLDGHLIRTVLETRCRQDGVHYTVERTEKISKGNSETGDSDQSLLTCSSDDAVLSREEHEEPGEPGITVKTVLEVRKRKDGTEYTNKTTVKTTQILIPQHETSYVVIKPDPKNQDDNEEFTPSLQDEVLHVRKKEEYDEQGNIVNIFIETRKSHLTGEKYTLTKKVRTTDIILTDSGEKILTRKKVNKDSPNAKPNASSKMTKSGNAPRNSSKTSPFKSKSDNSAKTNITKNKSDETKLSNRKQNEAKSTETSKKEDLKVTNTREVKSDSPASSSRKRREPSSEGSYSTSRKYCPKKSPESKREDKTKEGNNVSVKTSGIKKRSSTDSDERSKSKSPIRECCSRLHRNRESPSRTNFSKDKSNSEKENVPSRKKKSSSDLSKSRESTPLRECCSRLQKSRESSPIKTIAEKATGKEVIRKRSISPRKTRESKSPNENIDNKKDISPVRKSIAETRKSIEDSSPRKRSKSPKKNKESVSSNFISKEENKSMQKETEIGNIHSRKRSTSPVKSRESVFTRLYSNETEKTRDRSESSSQRKKSRDVSEKERISLNRNRSTSPKKTKEHIAKDENLLFSRKKSKEEESKTETNILQEKHSYERKSSAEKYFSTKEIDSQESKTTTSSRKKSADESDKSTRVSSTRDFSKRQISEDLFTSRIESDKAEECEKYFSRRKKSTEETSKSRESTPLRECCKGKLKINEPFSSPRSSTDRDKPSCESETASTRRKSSTDEEKSFNKKSSQSNRKQLQSTKSSELASSASEKSNTTKVRSYEKENKFVDTDLNKESSRNVSNIKSKYDSTKASLKSTKSDSQKKSDMENIRQSKATVDTKTNKFSSRESGKEVNEKVDKKIHSSILSQIIPNSEVNEKVERKRNAYETYKDYTDVSISSLGSLRKKEPISSPMITSTYIPPLCPTVDVESSDTIKNMIDKDLTLTSPRLVREDMRSRESQSPPKYSPSKEEFDNEIFSLTSARLVRETISPEKPTSDRFSFKDSDSKTTSRKSSKDESDYYQYESSSHCVSRKSSTSSDIRSYNRESPYSSREFSPSRFITGKPVDHGINSNKIKKLERQTSNKKIMENVEEERIISSTISEKIENIFNLAELEKLLKKADSYEERCIIRSRIRNVKRYQKENNQSTKSDTKKSSSMDTAVKNRLNQDFDKKSTNIKYTDKIDKVSNAKKFFETRKRSSDKIDTSKSSTSSNKVDKTFSSTKSFDSRKRSTEKMESTKSTDTIDKTEKTYSSSRYDSRKKSTDKIDTEKSTISSDKENLLSSTTTYFETRKKSTDNIDTTKSTFCTKNDTETKVKSVKTIELKDGSKSKKRNSFDNQTKKISDVDEVIDSVRKQQRKESLTKESRTENISSTENKSTTVRKLSKESVSKFNKVDSSIETKASSPVRKASKEFETKTDNSILVDVKSTTAVRKTSKDSTSKTDKSESTYSVERKSLSPVRKTSKECVPNYEKPTKSSASSKDLKTFECTRNVFAKSETKSPQVSKSKKIDNIKDSNNVETNIDKIISPYGVGPTDENGLPLYGLKALKARRTEKTDEENNIEKQTIITEKGSESYEKTEDNRDIFQTNIKNSVYEKDSTITDSDDRNSHQNDDTFTKKKNVKKIIELHESKRSEASPKPELSPPTKHKLRNSFVTSDESRDGVCTWDLKTDLAVKSDTVGNIIAKHETLTQPQENESKQSSGRFTTTIVTSSTEMSSAEDKDYSESSKTEMESSQSESKSFLSDHSKVTGISDILSRMGATEAVDHTAKIETAEEGKSLLNKFLGAQVLLTGVESMMNQSFAGNRPSNTFRPAVPQAPSSSQQSKPDIINGVNINEVNDSFELNDLLDSCGGYEERQRIRARLKEVVAIEKASGEIPGVPKKIITTKKVPRFGGIEGASTANQKSSVHKVNAPIFTFSAGGVTRSASGVKDMILSWCQRCTRNYQAVKIDNFSTSWNDGMAFCALIHNFYPDAYDFNKLSPKTKRYNFQLAFRVADERAGVFPLLDVDDMVMMQKPDWKCVFTYVQALYKVLKDL